jgi:hypothetical protein
MAVKHLKKRSHGIMAAFARAHVGAAFEKVPKSKRTNVFHAL